MTVTHLDRMRDALHPPPARVRRVDLIPALLTAALAVLGPALDTDRCNHTDGPQFACWLEDQ